MLLLLRLRLRLPAVAAAVGAAAAAAAAAAAGGGAEVLLTVLRPSHWADPLPRSVCVAVSCLPDLYSR